MAPDAPPVFDAPLPGGSEGAGVRVHPLLCGTAPAPPAYLRRPPGPLGGLRSLGAALTTTPGRRVALPLPAFLVEHPTAGPFMVDTGLAPAMVGGGREDLGRVAASVFGARVRADQLAGAQLRALGHDPEAIGLVVMTHLHYDHLGGSSQFPAAQFLVSRAEHEDPPGVLKGTWPQHREAVSAWRLVDGPGTPHAGLPRTWDVFGDGSVRLVATPGHSPGHLSVLLRLTDGRTALLTADASYTRRALDERIVPLLCPDVETYLRSLDELRAFVAAHPDALVLCGHDPDRFEPDSEAIAAASA